MQLTGREKATIFLSILGPDISSRILRYLPEELADLIASSVNHLPTPTPEALGEVLNDFKSFGALPPMRAEGPAPAKRFEEPPVPLTDLSPREVLENAPSQSLAFVLSGERPQIIAFILTNLTENKREFVLSSISAQKDIILSLIGGAKKNLISQQVQDRLINYFAEKLR